LNWTRPEPGWNSRIGDAGRSDGSLEKEQETATLDNGSQGLGSAVVIAQSCE
jgi:hypothetical protein